MSISSFCAHSQQPFSSEVFQNPPADCRGTPFWSWNGRMDKARLFRQLSILKQMGMGGATVHVRTGLSSPNYMSPEFLQLVRECMLEGERLGMLTWLYDEDRWPSGFAGGEVTTDPALRCRHLRLTRVACKPGEGRGAFVHHSPDLPVHERTFLAAWAMRLDNDGRISAIRRITHDQALSKDEQGLWAYLEVGPTSTWFNNLTYLDILNPKAAEKFVEVAHERYKAAVGDRFGTTIPAIFTDEPMFTKLPRWSSAQDQKDLCIPWTDDLPETYRSVWGEDLMDALPGVFLDRADGGSARDRWRFHDHHSERFASGFADVLGKWCQQNNIALTGHLMEEASLGRQTAWVGDAMRSYRNFQLPGIDLLCDQLEFTTAKQAQSAARQYGRPGLLSELYGVTNWDFDFQGHKRQGDWQAALGIIVRVHHLAWYSMEGEAKRDYPAAIGWQSPWWQNYGVVEDHFARVNTVLTRGRPRCRVAMIHGIESYWTERGPESAHSAVHVAQEKDFADSLTWLLHGLIDVDFICESTLPALSNVAAITSARLPVGSMAYEVVIVPQLRTLRSTTLDRLEAFVKHGGTVIFAGTLPELVDAVPSDRARRLALSCQQVAMSQAGLLSALEPWRDIDVRDDNAGRPNRLLHQIREEGDTRWMFLCNSDRTWGPGRVTLRVRGNLKVTLLNTADGTMQDAQVACQDEWSEMQVDIPAAGHVLVRCQPQTAKITSPFVKVHSRWSQFSVLDDPVPFRLEEPNVLLLDRAAWKLDNGAWQAETEVLRAGNLLRAAAGLPHQHGNVAQPWAQPPAPSRHRAFLAFTIHADVAVRAPRLGLERLAFAQVFLDGSQIPTKAIGHYIDEDIATIALPDLSVGTHRLEISWPLDSWNSPEACYLLGDFGVSVRGRFARIDSLPTTLAFGDITRQGLPFYGGNLVYECRITSDGSRQRLRFPHFKAPLLSVKLDKGPALPVAFAPFTCDLATLAKGDHVVEITAFGNRYNTLGQIHNTNPNFFWWGPSSYRTTNDQWSDAYVLRPHGILAAPLIERCDG